MKKEKQEEARLLRKEGNSLLTISKKLNVSKGSVSRWVRDIRLSKEQLAIMGLGRTKEAKRVWSEINRKNRIKFQNEGRQMMIENGPEFAFGCAILWAEGDKSKNVVSICNTDETMLIFFVNFLKKYFDVKNNDFTISINYYDTNGLSIEQIQKYWLEKFEFNLSSLRKCTLRSKYYSGDGKKYIYGICRIRVCRTDIVQKIFGAIKQMINDYSDRWID